jgi:hypothetical protein
MEKFKRYGSEILENICMIKVGAGKMERKCNM